jgi:hypothetical protein
MVQYDKQLVSKKELKNSLRDYQEFRVWACRMGTDWPNVPIAPPICPIKRRK